MTKYIETVYDLEHLARMCDTFNRLQALIAIAPVGNNAVKFISNGELLRFDVREKLPEMCAALNGALDDKTPMAVSIAPKGALIVLLYPEPKKEEKP